MVRRSVSYFFFSSRRRPMRSIRDWSSDVCSSDLAGSDGIEVVERENQRRQNQQTGEDCGARAVGIRWDERRVGKSVDLGGRRTRAKNKNRARARGRNRKTA